MNDNPHGWATATATAWEGNPGNLLPSKVEGWSTGSRRAATDAEEILSTAVAWWDASRYRQGDRFLRNQGTATSLLDARLGSSIDANSNDPLFLPAGDEGYMYLPGVVGNYASTPDSVALSITGDIDIKVKVALTDWTAGFIQTLVAKYPAQGNRSYRLFVNTDGTLSLAISDNGTSVYTGTSTVATGITDGATKWVRATLDVDNGSSQRVYKFYTSDDGATWTQLGTTVTSAGALSIFDGTGVLEIGSISVGAANMLIGTVYNVIIQSAYDTANNTDSLVFDSDFTRLAGNTTSFNAIGDTGIKNDGLVLKGRSGQYASTPDSPALSITEDIDIKVKVAMTDWTPAAVQVLVDKWLTSGDQRSYALRLDTAGTLSLLVSPAGTSAGVLTMTSTVATGFTDGATKWVRATLDVNDGAGNRVVKFYTSDDGTTWTQLGTTVTTAGTTSIFDSTAQLTVGGFGVGSLMAGTIYRTIIQSAYDTANNTDNVVFDSDFDAQTPETVSFRAIGETGIKEDGLLLKGRSGEYASVPDSTPLKITGDIDIKVKVALTDWTPAAQSGLIGKNQSGSVRSYWFTVESDGTLRLATSADGSTVSTATSSTVATGFTDGATKWVRATMDVDNGSSQRVVKFYTSDDGTTWTQLGTTVTTAGATSIFDTTAPVEIGTLFLGTLARMVGTVYRTIIQSAFDTADNTSNLAFDADFEAQTIGATEFSESSANKMVVTINGTNPLVTINGAYPVVTINRSSAGRKTKITPPRSLGGRSCFLLGTDDYFEVQNAWQHRLLNYDGNTSFTMLVVVRQWATPTNNGMYLRKGVTSEALWGFGAIGTTLGARIQASDINVTNVDFSNATGFVFGGMTAITTSVDRPSSVIRIYRNSDTPVQSTIKTEGFVSFTNFNIGRRPDGGNVQDFEFFAAAVFRRVLTPAEINTICRYYGAI